jgi:hypothetical protein
MTVELTPSFPAFDISSDIRISCLERPTLSATAETDACSGDQCVLMAKSDALEISDDRHGQEF